MSKRARRRATTEQIVAARMRDWRRLGYTITPQRKGRFKKHKPLDCGNTRCGLCHPEPVHGVGPRHLAPPEND